MLSTKKTLDQILMPSFTKYYKFNIQLMQKFSASGFSCLDFMAEEPSYSKLPLLYKTFVRIGH